jgi:transcription initiation factor TFIID subunit TAF12
LIVKKTAAVNKEKEYFERQINALNFKLDKLQEENKKHLEKNKNLEEENKVFKIKNKKFLITFKII